MRALPPTALASLVHARARPPLSRSCVTAAACVAVWALVAAGCSGDESPSDAGRLTILDGAMDAGPSTSDAGPSPGDAGSDASSPLHACCLIDGTCADRSAADCTAQPRFHSYQPMFFCDSFTCPDERQGACCDGEGNCMDGVTVDACGGGHRGEGTTCAMVDCAAP